MATQGPAVVGDQHRFGVTPRERGSDPARAAWPDFQRRSASPGAQDGPARLVASFARSTPNLIWLGLFMAGALVVLASMSFRGYEAGGRGILRTWELTHYAAFLRDPFYRDILWRSLGMSVQVTLWCLILGFPLAYMLSRLRGWSRALLYFTVLMPLLTSAVVRTFGWMILLSNNGFINKTLIALGLTEAPIPMMYRMTGIVIALVRGAAAVYGARARRGAPQHRPPALRCGAQSRRRRDPHLPADHAAARRCRG